MIARLWRGYVSKHIGTLLLAVFFMFILAATQAAYVYLISQVGEFLKALGAPGSAEDKTLSVAVKVAPLVIGLTVTAAIAMFVQAILTNKVALSTIRDLQIDMFSSAQRADYALFTREGSGGLVSRFINDVTILTGALLRTITNLGRDVFTVIGVLAVMLYTDWLLTILILGILIVIILPLVTLSRTLRGNSTDAQSQVGTITEQLSESFGGARLVKTYGLEDDQDTRLEKSFTERFRLYLKLVTNQARVDPMMEVIGGIAIVSVIIAGTWRVASGAIDGYGVASILAGLVVLTPKLRALGTLNNVIQEGLAALSRIFELIDQKPTIIDAPNAAALNVSKGNVEFTDVGFAYENGDGPALSDISLSAKGGQTIAFVGPSGGGKSTLLNLLPRLFDAASGEIAVDGQNIRGVTLSSLRENMALVSQDVTLFDDTVAANIGFGRKGASEDEIAAAAKQAAAHDFITALPQGYHTKVGPGGARLSGGQRQRIAIARAILRDAPILLLDEATSALDAQSEAQIQEALERLSKGRTSFVIAHRLSTVRGADQIIVLDNGRIAERGTHDSLIAAGGLYAQLAALQLS